MKSFLALAAALCSLGGCNDWKRSARSRYCNSFEVEATLAFNTIDEVGDRLTEYAPKSGSDTTRPHVRKHVIARARHKLELVNARAAGWAMGSAALINLQRSGDQSPRDIGYTNAFHAPGGHAIHESLKVDLSKLSKQQTRAWFKKLRGAIADQYREQLLACRENVKHWQPGEMALAIIATK